jgi:uncharacterized SAM-binding protein YcdF (DUF218 family)
MFYFLSKTIDFLVMPFCISLVLILFSIFTKKPKRKKPAVITAFLILFIISNPVIVNRAFLWWEPKPMNIGEVKKVYDVGVVLSGGLTSNFGLNADHVELGKHANRFYAAYLLYNAGKIKKILITGASPVSWIAAGKGESRQSAKILAKWGVPENDILLEEHARNTRENAIFSAKILNEKFPGGKVLLITSASHMKRSVGCFNKAGVNSDFFPCDFYGVSGLGVEDFFVPDSEMVGYFDLLWHEWVGYVTYRIMGYC